MGKLMQWQAWIWSCSVNRLLSAWLFAFDSDHDGFSCSKTVANEIFHCRNQMNIIILIHSNLQMGKKQANFHVNLVVEELTTLPSEWTLCRSFPVVVLRPHLDLWREVTTNPLVMLVWLETSTPLLSHCVICRGSLGVGKWSFHRFFTNKNYYV
jgi:hypothetical protein